MRKGIRLIPPLSWALLTWVPLSSAANIHVFASSNSGAAIEAEIHLYRVGTHADVWPVPHAQTAKDIKPGYYHIEISVPGFRSYTRDIEIFAETNDIRAVLLPSAEAVGQLDVSGRVIDGKSYDRLWVVAFPLVGNPSDSTQATVSSTGTFHITTTHPGPYVLVVVRGENMLGCKHIYIGLENPEVLIRVAE